MKASRNTKWLNSHVMSYNLIASFRFDFMLSCFLIIWLFLGKQASLAADFSIPQFAHICRLLLVHGRYCYKRSCALSQFVMHRGKSSYCL